MGIYSMVDMVTINMYANFNSNIFYTFEDIWHKENHQSWQRRYQRASDSISSHFLQKVELKSQYFFSMLELRKWEMLTRGPWWPYIAHLSHTDYYAKMIMTSVRKDICARYILNKFLRHQSSNIIAVKNFTYLDNVT